MQSPQAAVNRFARPQAPALTFRLAVLLLAALTALRLAGLWVNPLNLYGDEAQYWLWAQHPAWGYYSKPPLLAWLIGAAQAVCGTGEACIRAPMPLLHAATALCLGLLGRRLFDERVGAAAVLAYALLPGVSFSSGIASTDTPLLFAWALALLALERLVVTRRWLLWGAALGAALALGLYAKYAMAYFGLGFVLLLALAGEARRGAVLAGAGVALAVAALLLAPHIAWNAQNSFATVQHVGENAAWSTATLRPGKALEFIGGQFGVFGPILFVALLAWPFRGRLAQAPLSWRLLAAFAYPVLVIVATQALISRAHANWAAVAYVAGTVLVCAWLAGTIWLRATLVLHALAALVLLAGPTLAPLLPAQLDPTARLRGWDRAGAAVAAELRARPDLVLMADDRMLLATMAYYARPTQARVWEADGRAANHFEMNCPYRGAAHTLYVSLWPQVAAVQDRFDQVRPLAVAPAGRRQVHLFAATGFRGYAGAGPAWTGRPERCAP